MGITQRLWFRVLNDLVHDVTAGVVPGAVLALWLVRTGAKATLNASDLSALAQSWTWIVPLIFGALVIFAVTGSIRLGYRTRNLRPDALQAQGRAALIKHGVFILLFLYATVMAFVVIQP
jgi:hypothetical protein